MAEERITRLHAASEVIEGATYEYPGYLSVTRGDTHYAFGTVNGPLGYDFGPADDPGALRDGGEKEIDPESSVGEIVRYVQESIEDPPSLRVAAQAVMDLLGQADPTGYPGRHPEFPFQIIAAEDRADELCAALQALQAALVLDESSGVE